MKQSSRHKQKHLLHHKIKEKIKDLDETKNDLVSMITEHIGGVQLCAREKTATSDQDLSMETYLHVMQMLDKCSNNCFCLLATAENIFENNDAELDALSVSSEEPQYLRGTGSSADLVTSVSVSSLEKDNDVDPVRLGSDRDLQVKAGVQAGAEQVVKNEKSTRPVEVSNWSDRQSSYEPSKDGISNQATYHVKPNTNPNTTNFPLVEMTNNTASVLYSQDVRAKTEDIYSHLTNSSYSTNIITAVSTVVQPSTPICFADMPQTSACFTNMPQTSVPLTEIPTSEGFADMPQPSAGFAHMPQTSVSLTEIPTSSEGFAHMPQTSACFTNMPQTSVCFAGMPQTSDYLAKMPQTSACFTSVPRTTTTISQISSPDISVTAGFSSMPRSSASLPSISQTSACFASMPQRSASFMTMPQSAVPLTSLPHIFPSVPDIPQSHVSLTEIPTSASFAHMPQSSVGFAHMPQTYAGFANMPQTSVSLAEVPTAAGFAHMPQTSVTFAHMPQSSAGFAHMPQSSAGFANMPQTSVGFANMPQTSVSLAEVPTSAGFAHMPQTSVAFAHMPQSSAGFARMPQSSVGFANMPQTSVSLAEVPTSADFAHMLQSYAGFAHMPQSSAGFAHMPQSSAGFANVPQTPAHSAATASQTPPHSAAIPQNSSSFTSSLSQTSITAKPRASASAESVPQKSTSFTFMPQIPASLAHIPETTSASLMSTRTTFVCEAVTSERAVVAQMSSAATESGVKTQRPEAPLAMKLLSLVPGGAIRVVVSEIDTPWSFYVQPISHVLDDLRNKIQCHISKMDPAIFRPEPRPGMVCLAPFLQEKPPLYYRAKVIRTDTEPEGKAEVLYVDFGNTGHVPLTAIVPLPAEFTTLPAQAIFCALSAIAPTNKLGLWTPDEIQAFKTCVIGQQLYLEPASCHSTHPFPYLVTLFWSVPLLPDDATVAKGTVANAPQVQFTQLPVVNLLLEQGMARPVSISEQMNKLQRLFGETDLDLTSLVASTNVAKAGQQRARSKTGVGAVARDDESEVKGGGIGSIRAAAVARDDESKISMRDNSVLSSSSVVGNGEVTSTAKSDAAEEEGGTDLNNSAEEPKKSVPNLPSVHYRMRRRAGRGRKSCLESGCDAETGSKSNTEGSVAAESQQRHAGGSNSQESSRQPELTGKDMISKQCSVADNTSSGISQCHKDITGISQCDKDITGISQCDKDITGISQCDKDTTSISQCEKDTGCISQCEKDTGCISHCDKDAGCISQYDRDTTGISQYDRDTTGISQCDRDTGCISQRDRDTGCISQRDRDTGCISQRDRDATGISLDSLDINQCDRNTISVSHCNGETSRTTNCHRNTSPNSHVTPAGGCHSNTAAADDHSFVPSTRSNVHFDVLVSHIATPTDFHVHRVTSETGKTLERLMKDLNLLFERRSKRQLKKISKEFVPKVDQLCCAKFSKDDCFYRAQVVDVTEREAGDRLKHANTVRVFYLDFGDAEWLSRSSVYPLPEEFTLLPPLAIWCSLAHVVPLELKDVENGFAVPAREWSQKGIEVFEDLAQFEKKLKLCIVSGSLESKHERCRIQTEPLQVYLLDNTANEEVCINLELMNRDLAMLDFEVDPREGENQDNKTGDENDCSSEVDLCGHWDPMAEDFLSLRNSYNVDIDDVGVATVGYTSAPRLVQQSLWNVLSCLWDGAYKRTLAANRRELLSAY